MLLPADEDCTLIGKEADHMSRKRGYTAADMLDWSNRVMNSLAISRVATEPKIGETT